APPPAPAAAVRPAGRGDPARAAHPRRERAAARARRRRLLRARPADLGAAAADPAAPPGPTTRRGRRPGEGHGMSALYELPVFGLALTLGVYLASHALYHRL